MCVQYRHVRQAALLRCPVRSIVAPEVLCSGPSVLCRDVQRKIEHASRRVAKRTNRTSAMLRSCLQSPPIPMMQVGRVTIPAPWVFLRF